MIEEIINNLELRMDDLARLINDLDDEQMVCCPVAGMNHAKWELGHIVYSFQAIGGEMGVSTWLSEEWCDLFGQGSCLQNDPSVYPGKQKLVAALDDGKKRMIQRLQSLVDDDLSRPLPDTRYRQIFPTLGHAVLNTLVSHLSLHVGRLSNWRRAMKLSLPSGGGI